MIGIDWGAATDRGLVRAVNEDALLAQPPVFVVADGMGGHAAGDVASAIVVEEFRRPCALDAVSADWIVDVLRRAGHRIRAESGGGTTVAGIATVEQSGVPYWLVFNLGDSRIYLHAQDAMTQISVDHSVVQELIDAGEIDASQAERHPERHVLTRAVGSSVPPDPDFWLLPADRGDRAMVCSDGLTRELGADEIRALLASVAGPQLVAEQLVAAALSAGGHDNVTAIVVDLIGADRRPADPSAAVQSPRTDQTIPRIPGFASVTGDRRRSGAVDRRPARP